MNEWWTSLSQKQIVCFNLFIWIYKSAKCNTLEWKAIVASTRWLQKTHILSCCAACPKNKRKRDKSRTKEEDLEYK